MKDERKLAIAKNALFIAKQWMLGDYWRHSEDPTERDAWKEQFDLVNKAIEELKQC
jgi:hypothetical protein